jgi:hypothetical protein
MSRYAIIENTQVINIVEYESDPGNPPPGFAEGVVAVQSDVAQPGDQYLDGQFVNPNPPQPLVADVSDLRRVAYVAEADPLFFKAQRGEATAQDWRDKIAEIRARFQNPAL